jgi:signal transduction histidine kinase
MDRIKYFLHDLNNKLGIISYHLNGYKENGELNYDATNAALQRSISIIKQAYIAVKGEKTFQMEAIDFHEFNSILEAEAERLQVLFPKMRFQFKYAHFDKNNLLMILNMELFQQALENVVENCHKADAKNVRMSLKVIYDNFVFDIKDNGKSYENLPSGTIPHGIGTEVIKENLKLMDGEALFKGKPEGFLVRFKFKTISAKDASKDNLQ